MSLPLVVSALVGAAYIVKRQNDVRTDVLNIAAAQKLRHVHTPQYGGIFIADPGMAHVNNSPEKGFLLHRDRL